MSKTTNSVFIVGIPKFVKTEKAGQSTVTRFSLNHTDKKETVHYFPVEMWNVSDEQMALLKSGDLVLVKASLKFSSYEKDGVKVNKVTLTGFEVQLESDDTPVAQAATKSPKLQRQVTTKPVVTNKTRGKVQESNHDDAFEEDEDPFSRS